MFGILLYHYILFLIILQDMLLCNCDVFIWWSYIFDCLYLSLICHSIYYCLFVLATELLLYSVESFILCEDRV